MSAGTPEPLLIATRNEPPNQTADGRGTSDLFVREAFRRVGHDVVFKVYPLARAAHMLQRGEIAGDFRRIAGLERELGRVERVDFPLGVVDVVAISRAPGFVPKGWTSLPGTRSGHVLGWKVCEYNLPPTHKQVVALDFTQLLALIREGRVDFGCYHRPLAEKLRKTAAFRGLVINEPSIAKMPNFLYLSDRHKALAPKLETAMRTMKEEGWVVFDETQR